MWADCSDAGDPTNCTARKFTGIEAAIRDSLNTDGTLMLVEPMAGDRLEDNLNNPVGRTCYASSANICVPLSGKLLSRRRPA